MIKEVLDINKRSLKRIGPTTPGRWNGMYIADIRIHPLIIYHHIFYLVSNFNLCKTFYSFLHFLFETISFLSSFMKIENKYSFIFIIIFTFKHYFINFYLFFFIFVPEFTKCRKIWDLKILSVNGVKRSWHALSIFPA